MITKLRSKFSREDGFTLVELMLVIVVLGTLAGVAVPRLTGIGDRADKAAVESDLRNIQNALEMYRMDVGNYPETSDGSDDDGLSELVDPKDDDGNAQDDGYTTQAVIDDPTDDDEVYNYDVNNDDNEYIVWTNEQIEGEYIILDSDEGLDSNESKPSLEKE
ncbi:type II secretion system protein [Natroniella sp. ANB-PHB2]|uniref:type II secretion system protein n=1 Tax=Natroniella sp. ANB-PHB2 TaxID=3384444 RepID=UPI0038D4FEAE